MFFKLLGLKLSRAAEEGSAHTGALLSVMAGMPARAGQGPLSFTDDFSPVG